MDVIRDYFVEWFGYCLDFEKLSEHLQKFQKLYYPDQDWSEMCNALKNHPNEKFMSEEQRRAWLSNLKKGDLVQDRIVGTPRYEIAPIFKIEDFEEDPINGIAAKCSLKYGKDCIYFVENQKDFVFLVRDLFPCDEQNLRFWRDKPSEDNQEETQEPQLEVTYENEIIYEEPSPEPEPQKEKFFNIKRWKKKLEELPLDRDSFFMGACISAFSFMVIFVFSWVIRMGPTDNVPIQYLEKPVSYENKKEASFRVFQVIDSNTALAHEGDYYVFDTPWKQGNTVVLFGSEFHNDQLVTIKNPQKVGIYTCFSGEGFPRKVPVVTNKK